MKSKRLFLLLLAVSAIAIYLEISECIFEDQKDEFSRIIFLLENGDVKQRIDAARKLYDFKRSGVRYLLHAQKDRSEFVRIAARRTIERIGTEAEIEIVRFLKSGTIEERESAITAVGILGLRKPCILAIALDDEERYIRSIALLELALLESKSFLILKRAMKHDIQDVRISAVHILHRQLPLSASEIECGLQSPYSDVRDLVASLLRDSSK